MMYPWVWSKALLDQLNIILEWEYLSHLLPYVQLIAIKFDDNDDI